MDENTKKPPQPIVTSKRVVVKPSIAPTTATPVPEAKAVKTYKSPLEHPENKKKIDHFIAEHAPLIQKQIHKLKAEGKIPSSIDPNDLVVSGFSGIMQAVHRYDAKTGTPFAHFANLHIRNRILDHIVHSGDIPKEMLVQARRFKEFKARQEASKASVTESQPKQESIAPPEIKPETPKVPVNEEDDGFFDQ